MIRARSLKGLHHILCQRGYTSKLLAPAERFGLRQQPCMPFRQKNTNSHLRIVTNLNCQNVNFSISTISESGGSNASLTDKQASAYRKLMLCCLHDFILLSFPVHSILLFNELFMFYTTLRYLAFITLIVRDHNYTIFTLNSQIVQNKL